MIFCRKPPFIQYCKNNVSDFLYKQIDLTGRKGKGTIFVSPPGNGGLSRDSCAFDERNNHIGTLAINGAGERGSIPRQASIVLVSILMAMFEMCADA